jgi:hypothetical protein
METRNIPIERLDIADVNGIGRLGTLAACNPTFKIEGTGTYRVSLAIKRGAGTHALRSSNTIRAERILVFASIGDSYASGEGNPSTSALTKFFGSEDASIGEIKIGAGLCEKEFERYDKFHDGPMPADATETWDLEDSDWRSTVSRHGAHRSTVSGPALASDMIGGHGDLVAFASAATSGAQILNGIIHPLTSPLQQKDQLTRLREILRNRHIDILTVSAGGNDIGFAGTVAALNTQSGGQKAFQQNLEPKFLSLGAAFDSLRAMVDRLAPTKVYLTQYPVGLFNNRDGAAAEGCGLFDNSVGEVEVGPAAKITVDDATLIATNGTRLNGILAQKSAAFGWVYVDGIADAFATHGYCTGQETFYRGGADSCREQADFRGVLHPNGKGAQAIAAQIARLVNLTFY